MPLAILAALFGMHLVIEFDIPSPAPRAYRATPFVSIRTCGNPLFPRRLHIRPSQISLDLVEHVRPSNRTTPDHQACRTRHLQARSRGLGADNITVGDHRNRDRLAHSSNRLPVGCA